MALHTLIRVCS